MKWTTVLMVISLLQLAQGEVEEDKMIVGGKDAEEGKYPFYVKINIKYKGRFFHNCGGALISPEYILTAANCIENKTFDIWVS